MKGRWIPKIADIAKTFKKLECLGVDKMCVHLCESRTKDPMVGFSFEITGYPPSFHRLSVYFVKNAYFEVDGVEDELMWKIWVEKQSHNIKKIEG